MYEHLTNATMENLETGTHVLVHVGSGTVLRPGIVEGFGTTSPYRGGPKSPAVKIGFVWANGRVTHKRVFGVLTHGNDVWPAGTVYGTFLAPEPHDAATVEVLTNPATAYQSDQVNVTLSESDALLLLDVLAEARDRTGAETPTFGPNGSVRRHARIVGIRNAIHHRLQNLS